jgi:transmembrane sensor
MRKAMTDCFERLPSSAEDWIARMQSRPLTPEESDAFAAWLAADPAARAEYRRCEHVGRLGDRLRAMPHLVGAMPAYALLKSPGTTRSESRWKWSLGIAAAACAALVAVFVVPQFSTRPLQTVATLKGEQRELALDDGTKVHLNTDSVVRIDYQERERRIELAKGEAYFEVTKDREGRPFIVNAATTQVRVLGTKFSVRSTNNRTEVLVAEGKVEVLPDTARNAASVPAKVELVPGNVLRIDPEAQSVQMAAVNPDRVASWRSGTIEFDNATVEEVISEVNRYSKTPFVIADPRVKDVRLSGTFKVGDTQSVRFGLLDGFRITSSLEKDRILLKLAD